MCACVLAENNTHDLSLISRTENDKCFVYEHKDVEVSPGVYTTKTGVSFQVDNPNIVKYTNPRLRKDGKGIVVWFPVCHHVVCGNIEQNKIVLQNKIGAVIGDDVEQDRVIDRMLGTSGQGIKFVDGIDGNGNVIKDVLFVEHNYLLPHGIKTENRYFTPGKPAHDDNHFDCNLIVMTDIKYKSTSSHGNILNSLRDSLPTAGNIVTAGSASDRLALYKAGTQEFVKAQLSVNTAMFASVEFYVFGEDQADRMAASDSMNITTLMTGMDFLG